MFVNLYIQDLKKSWLSISVKISMVRLAMFRMSHTPPVTSGIHCSGSFVRLFIFIDFLTCCIKSILYICQSSVPVISVILISQNNRKAIAPIPLLPDSVAYLSLNSVEYVLQYVCTNVFSQSPVSCVIYIKSLLYTKKYWCNLFTYWSTKCLLHD